jgi:GNAT superfamily N-acetyltransferase
MIRLATPADVETIAKLLIEFRDWWNSPEPPDEVFHTTVAKLIHDPNTDFLLAGEDQGVAQLRYRLSAWGGREDCWLEDVYVTDAARGTGLGRALTQAAIERARERGCQAIELDVNEQNTRAHALYVSCGFKAEPKPPGRTLFLGMDL